MAWTNLSFSYGSKLTSTQMTQMFDNFAALAAGSSGAPALVVAEANISAAAVAQAKLKTSYGSVSAAYSSPANATLPGGEYGFWVQVMHSTGGGASTNASLAVNVTSTSFVTNIYLESVAGGTAYAQQRYVTSSGEVHWVFVLRDKDTKNVLSIWEADDHPCFGNGGKPMLVPHPFPDFDPGTQEIIVINPDPDEIKRMRGMMHVEDEDKPNRVLLEIIQNEYRLDEKSRPDWPEIPVTVGLPDGHTWKDALAESNIIRPVKKQIIKPAYIQTRALIRK